VPRCARLTITPVLRRQKSVARSQSLHEIEPGEVVEGVADPGARASRLLIGGKRALVERSASV